jgi:hypothetical protein
MSRSRRRKKPLLDWDTPTATLRECYSLLAQVEDAADELNTREAHQREVDLCYDEFERYPQDHPRYAAALERLRYLQSHQYAASRTFKLQCKKTGRRTKHALILALWPVIDMTLIVVFNVAGVMLLFWLLSLI